MWEQNCTKSAKVPPSRSLRGLEWKNLPCIDYTAAGILPNKIFLFNSNVIHWINKTVNDASEVQRDWHTKHQTTQYPVKWFLIYFFIFLLFFPSEMTGLEMVSNSPLLLSCMWADMSLCRHLLASMEGQDAQYKLSNGSPTLLIWLPLLDSFTLSGSQGFRLVPKPQRHIKRQNQF